MRNLLFVMGALFVLGFSSCNNQRVPPFSADADHYTNSIGMKFNRIKPGKFMMGSEPSIPLYEDDEILHQVEITKPFFMGVFEVTQAQYTQVMSDSPSYNSKTGDGAKNVEGLDTNKFPVDNVSWDDAVEFCKRLNALEKGANFTYRLPTEAEWEYAYRAGTTTAFDFGEKTKGLECNCRGTNSYPPMADDKDAEIPGKNLGRTTDVGSYQPNAWGLYDMSGNVWEWVNDWYDSKYGFQSSDDGNLKIPELTVDPVGPLPPEQADEAEKFRKKYVKKTVRGGSYAFPAVTARGANRKHELPTERKSVNGFRVVLEPK